MNVFNIGVKKAKRINCKQVYSRMGSSKNYAHRSTFRIGPETVNKICRVGIFETQQENFNEQVAMK
jgi:hypothetical protein